MFGFMRGSGGKNRSAAIQRALERDGLPPGIDAAVALGVVESGGSYAGRRVSYIRVFDPARAAEQAVDVHAFGDLDGHPDLVLRMGHVEKDGTVVITWRPPAADAATPVRARADRAMHADDERFVFPADYRRSLGGG
jgi:hypothetical protein